MRTIAIFTSGLVVGIHIHRKMVGSQQSPTMLMIKRHMKLAVLNITHEILQDSLRPVPTQSSTIQR